MRLARTAVPIRRSVASAAWRSVWGGPVKVSGFGSVGGMGGGRAATPLTGAGTVALPPLPPPLRGREGSTPSLPPLEAGEGAGVAPLPDAPAELVSALVSGS